MLHRNFEPENKFVTPLNSNAANAISPKSPQLRETGSEAAHAPHSPFLSFPAERCDSSARGRESMPVKKKK
jgi:hypothetical protein